jgi:hypothetical protein
MGARVVDKPGWLVCANKPTRLVCAIRLTAHPHPFVRDTICELQIHFLDIFLKFLFEIFSTMCNTTVSAFDVGPGFAGYLASAAVWGAANGDRSCYEIQMCGILYR